MVGSRTLTAAVGLALGLAASYAAWRAFDTVALVLFLPVLPLLFRDRDDGGDERARVWRCPACGFETREPAHAYCPYDGSELEPEPRGADTVRG